MVEGLCPLYVCGDGSSPIIDIDVLVVFQFQPSGGDVSRPRTQNVNRNGCGADGCS